MHSLLLALSETSSSSLEGIALQLPNLLRRSYFFCFCFASLFVLEEEYSYFSYSFFPFSLQTEVEYTTFLTASCLLFLSETVAYDQHQENK